MTITCAPRLTLETLVNQEPPKTTSLLKFFCPLCGTKALTEKIDPGVYRVSCGLCHKASIIQISRS